MTRASASPRDGSVTSTMTVATWRMRGIVVSMHFNDLTGFLSLFLSLSPCLRLRVYFGGVSVGQQNSQCAWSSSARGEMGQI